MANISIHTSDTYPIRISTRVQSLKSGGKCVVIKFEQYMPDAPARIQSDEVSLFLDDAHVREFISHMESALKGLILDERKEPEDFDDDPFAKIMEVKKQ